MLTIVGLGNPGILYDNTRHNTGRIILLRLVKEFDFDDWKNDIKLKSLRSKGNIENEKMEFILPNNFMNNSGQFIPLLIDTPLKLKNFVVIYDDIDLPLGSLKISHNRSSGGHNGVESIIKKLKTKDFIRIRIGISPTTPKGKIKKPKGEAAILKFLLGNFKESEIKTIKNLSKIISKIIISLSIEGKDKTMTLYN